MRGGSLLLGTICLLATVPAVAGTVFRCETADGGRSYVSKRVSGGKCTPVSSYSASRYQPPAVSMPSRPASVGSVVPVNNVAGSPASIDSGAPATFMDAPSGGGARPAAAPAPVRSSTGAPRLVQGQVYSYIKDGVRHYSSKRPKGVANASAVRTIKYSFMETCFACAAKPGVNFGSIRLNTEAFRHEIAAAAQQYGVEEAIVRAIIHAESAYNPNALSRVGAQGLMQLMPATARRFGVSNSFDAGQNIRGGVQYLAWLLKRFNGNLTLAAAGYNAGEGAVDKYKGVPPYSETQRYVVRVGQLAERYRGTPLTR
ncbi:lytic transglycosylase domain-containing protein [Lysobacter koreensis]|uniref:Lytic transglycosylase domain-containing protein n=1 Tax=Lysobacter koreensis TaxID=266122 RepID=A0ABW2YSI2_9GAMM